MWHAPAVLNSNSQCNSNTSSSLQTSTRTRVPGTTVQHNHGKRSCEHPFNVSIIHYFSSYYYFQQRANKQSWCGTQLTKPESVFENPLFEEPTSTTMRRLHACTQCWARPISTGSSTRSTFSDSGPLWMQTLGFLFWPAESTLLPSFGDSTTCRISPHGVGEKPWLPGVSF